MTTDLIYEQETMNYSRGIAKHIKNRPDQPVNSKTQLVSKLRTQILQQKQQESSQSRKQGTTAPRTINPSRTTTTGRVGSGRVETRVNGSEGRPSTVPGSKPQSESRRRSRSSESRTPPPVLRRRLDRPGRAVGTKPSEVPACDTRKIASRVLPQRRPHVSFAPRSTMTTTLDMSSTSGVAKAKSLRSRIEDISMRNESSMISTVNMTGDYSRLGLERALGVLKHNSSTLSRPIESRLGAPILPRTVRDSDDRPDSPDTFNFMSRSIRDGAKSPSSSASRRELIRLELERKQKELVELYSIESPRHLVADKSMDDCQVLSLDSMEITRSSVSCLAQLIRAKEEGLNKQKSEYKDEKKALIDRRRELVEQEMKLKQIEYLKQLEEEERLIREKTESTQKVSESLSEKIRNQSMLIERLVSVSTPSPKAAPVMDELVDGSPDVTTARYMMESLSPRLSETVMMEPLVLMEDSLDIREVSRSVERAADSDATEPDEGRIEPEVPKLNKLEEMVIDEQSPVVAPVIPKLNFRLKNDEEKEEEPVRVTPSFPVIPKLCFGKVDEVDDLPSQPVEEPLSQTPIAREFVIPTLNLAKISSPPASPREPVEDQVANVVVNELIESVVIQRFPVPACPPPKRPLPFRVDAFDLPIPGTVSDVNLPIGEITKTIIEASLAALGITEASAPLSDDELEVIGGMNWIEILQSLVPESMLMCLVDVFVGLLDSLPPAATAERKFKRSGVRNPMASFLPSRHSIARICDSLRELMDEHCKPTKEEEKFVDELCDQFVHTFNADDVLFSKTRDIEDEEFEAQIFDEVSRFIMDAVVTSVGNDFEFSNRDGQAVLSS